MAYLEVLSGLRLRGKSRMENATIAPADLPSGTDTERKAVASKSALFLVLGRPKLDGKGGIDAIASVELRLQPADAKIPFSLPLFDRIERSLGALLSVADEKKLSDLQPYLSSLCVRKEYRGRGIGKMMVKCLENIAFDTWGYSKLYLHVDYDNPGALRLYQKENFQPVGARWNPFWAGKAVDIGYFVKTCK
mmetsp:Transcript_27790/g.42757  ORF Transcript_27790/g.42757 Transcript_27790/m.42757 type:complete len:192 (+) Transcript_27790:483-1058(+)